MSNFADVLEKGIWPLWRIVPRAVQGLDLPLQGALLIGSSAF